MKNSHSLSRLLTGFLFIVAVSTGVAYFSGGPANFFGHSPGEIENEFITVTQACNDMAVPGGQYKYCEALCPIGSVDYYAFSGSCKTIVNDFPNNDSGYRYNLSGALRDLSGWSCFNGALANDPNEYLEVSVTCARTGGFTSNPHAFCGNYRIENGEVCDAQNFGDWLDCSDFLTAGGQPLCNGTLACGSSCSGFDISSCVYCNSTPPGSCAPGQLLCQDGTCQTSCSANGGQAGILAGNAATNCQPGVPCVGAPGFTLPSGFCGDDIIDPSLGELCENDDDCMPGVAIDCPDGSQGGNGEVCEDCGCENNDYPCCRDAFGQPECKDNTDCGLGFGGHPVCVLGCCVPLDI